MFNFWNNSIQPNLTNYETVKPDSSLIIAAAVPAVNVVWTSGLRAKSASIVRPFAHPVR